MVAVVVVVVVVVSRRRSGRHRTTGLGGSTAVSTTETAYPPVQSRSCGGLSHGDDEENYRALVRCDDRRMQLLMPRCKSIPKATMIKGLCAATDLFPTGSGYDAKLSPL